MEFLIQKAKNGDKEAFIEVINANTTKLYKIGKTILSNDSDIGDAIQETILTAYEKLYALKEPNYFNTWLIRIFINKCNLIIKKNKKIISIDEIVTLNYKDQALENIELKEAINKLKYDYRIAICLHYIMGFNIKEISQILDTKEGTIKSRLCRARNELRHFYGINKEVK